jgi:hypothetical protein
MERSRDIFHDLREMEIEDDYEEVIQRMRMNIIRTTPGIEKRKRKTTIKQWKKQQ